MLKKIAFSFILFLSVLIGVVMVNLGREPVRIERGDRIAQLVIQRLPAVAVSEVETLPETSRGGGGFGHTGER